MIQRRSEENRDKSFVGSFVLGMGFTFDDTDTQGVASPLVEMRRLIAEDPRNGDVILPVYRRPGGQQPPAPRAPSVRDQLQGLAAQAA